MSRLNWIMIYRTLSLFCTKWFSCMVKLPIQVVCGVHQTTFFYRIETAVYRIEGLKELAQSQVRTTDSRSYFA